MECKDNERGSSNRKFKGKEDVRKGKLKAGRREKRQTREKGKGRAEEKEEGRMGGKERPGKR